jgi:hypothetical protein
VFLTRKPVAALSITSPRRGAAGIAKRIARVTIVERIDWLLSFSEFFGLMITSLFNLAKNNLRVVKVMTEDRYIPLDATLYIFNGHGTGRALR